MSRAQTIAPADSLQESYPPQRAQQAPARSRLNKTYPCGKTYCHLKGKPSRLAQSRE